MRPVNVALVPDGTSRLTGCCSTWPTNSRLSKAEVLSTPSLCAVNARPKYTVFDIVMLMEPTCDQLVPSGDTNPVNRLPARVSLTQYGAPTAGPEALSLLPFEAVRYWKVAPFVQEIAMSAFLEPAARLSRNITPPLAHG